MESDGEENEAALGLDEKRLLLLGEVDLSNELAVNVVAFSSDILGRRCLGSVELVALGEEGGLREVVVSLGEVELSSTLLRRRGVDVDASKAGSHLLGRGLEVVLSDGRHCELLYGVGGDE